MDFLFIFALPVLGLIVLNKREQRARAALLGSYLGRFRIEQLMERLTQGYLRALGETDPARQAQVWQHLSADETELCLQFNAFVLEFSAVDAALTRVSRWPMALPYATVWAPSSSFDLRKALSIHAHALNQAASNSQHQAPKDKAFTLLAELLLMQHTCHWYCRSKMVASARLLARHQTAYAQVLSSVAPATRRAYGALVGARV